jgi:hypothetical protein
MARVLTGGRGRGAFVASNHAVEMHAAPAGIRVMSSWRDGRGSNLAVALGLDPNPPLVEKINCSLSQRRYGQFLYPTSLSVTHPIVLEAGSYGPPPDQNRPSFRSIGTRRRAIDKTGSTGDSLTDIQAIRSFTND